MNMNSIINSMRAKLRELGCKISKGSFFVFEGNNVPPKVEDKAKEIGFKFIKKNNNENSNN